MKKIIFIGIAASLFTACGIYKPYTRPEVRTDDLYGAEYATADTASIADIGWRELFTDRLRRWFTTPICRWRGCALRRPKRR